MPTPKETKPLPHRDLFARADFIVLSVLLTFTLVAVLGYAIFGLHPELLARFPNLAPLYGPAFTFFAQGHVIVSGLALLVILIMRVRWRWALAFIAVYAISLTAELIGTQSGFPFGDYHYTGLLGARWFGHVPLLIPLSWFCMALPAYVLALRYTPGRPWVRVVSAAALLTIWDLSLDPAMSYLTSYWIWDQAGAYYGMPLVNLLGWFGTGLLIAATLQRLGAHQWGTLLPPRWTAWYYAIVLAMPVGMAIAARLWGAVLLTLTSTWLWVVVMRHVRRRVVPDDHSEAEALHGGARPDEHRQSAVQRLPQGNPASVAVSAASDSFPAPVTQSIDQHSKSFSFASRLLGSDDRAIICSLYRFCRTTDDLVDLQTGAPAETVSRELDHWIGRARAAYHGQSSGLAWLDDLMHRSRNAGAPFALVEELAEGVRSDIGPVELRTAAELDLYCHRVASVIGVWMCHLVGVHDPAVLRRAAQMGRAMQLTNILRDVGEDLAHNRIYLPAEMLRNFDVRRADLEAMRRDGPINPRYRRLVDHLIEEAQRSYDEAWSGLILLPTRPARAFAVAAAVYNGILPAVRRGAHLNLRRRSYTTFPHKVWLAAGALLRLRRERRRFILASATTRRFHLRNVVHKGTVLLLLVALAMAATPGHTTFASGRIGAGTQAIQNDTSGADADPVNAADWLVQLRSQFLRAVDDPGLIEEARTTIDPLAGKEPLADAYGAAFHVLEAKHTRWPHRKWRHLRRGLGELDALVALHPQQVEIRYLRLLSCYFLPGLFGRTWSVAEDFDEVARLLPDARSNFSPGQFEQMVRFVMDAGNPSPQAHRALSEALKSLEADGFARSGGS